MSADTAVALRIPIAEALERRLAEERVAVCVDHLPVNGRRDRG